MSARSGRRSGEHQRYREAGRHHIVDNFESIAREKGSEQVQIAVQVGGATEKGNIDRYLVGPTGADKIASFQGDTRAPDTLTQFVEWGMKALPARHTMVVIGGHGEGHRGVCTDGKGGPDRIRLADLGPALKGVDVLGFDACQMGQLEALGALGQSVPLVVASEELIGPNGWPYAAILADMKASPAQTPRELAAAIVEHAGADQKLRQESGAPSGVFTLAAYDVTKVDGFTARVGALASAVVDSTTHPAILRGALTCAQSFNRGIPHAPDSDFRDVVGFALQLANSADLDDETVSEAARDAGSTTPGRLRAVKMS